MDLVRNEDDPQLASKMLVDYALQRFSSDNLSCMIVRLDHQKPAVEELKQVTKEEATAPVVPASTSQDTAKKATAEETPSKEVPSDASKTEASLSQSAQK